MKQLIGLGALGLTLGVISTASAHISLDDASTHKSRYEDSLDTKQPPCGVPKGPSRVNVYTYEPGETITVSVAEIIPHPSYFRIAFDDDGDDDFLDPRWIVPIDPVGRGGCPLDAVDQCRMGVQSEDGDFYNTPAVLPGMDNLEPHVAAASQGTYTWQVTLPDVECDNCTLQIIQVMEDPALGIHGSYNTMNGDDNDVYHQCIDLVLKRSGAGPGQEDAGVMGVGGMLGTGGMLGGAGMFGAGGGLGGAGMFGAGGTLTAGMGGMAPLGSGGSIDPAGGMAGGAESAPGQPGMGGAVPSGAGGGAAAVDGYANPGGGSDDGGGCAMARTGGGSVARGAFGLVALAAALLVGRRRRA